MPRRPTTDMADTVDTEAMAVASEAILMEDTEVASAVATEEASADSVEAMADTEDTDMVTTITITDKG